MSGSDSYFPRVRFYRSIHLHLLNSMCLYDMLCSSLGMIKFDIASMVSYLFENIHFLLILKYLVHYLRLPLIAIFAYDLLKIVLPKEIVLINPRCISSCQSYLVFA